MQFLQVFTSPPSYVLTRQFCWQIICISSCWNANWMLFNCLPWCQFSCWEGHYPKYEIRKINPGTQDGIMESSPIQAPLNERNGVLVEDIFQMNGGVPDSTELISATDPSMEGGYEESEEALCIFLYGVRWYYHLLSLSSNLSLSLYSYCWKALERDSISKRVKCLLVHDGSAFACYCYLICCKFSTPYVPN